MSTLSDKRDTSPSISIIPQPNEVVQANGEFVLTASTSLQCDVRGRAEAELLSDFLRNQTGLALPVIVSDAEALEMAPSNTIRLFLDGDGKDRDESYTLTVMTNHIELKAKHGAGILYAAQTLRQLVTKGESAWVVPAVTVRDAARFSWRGMHLDVGRHLFPVADIKKYIDTLSLHKFNIFHWHLTEDQGWRIEIKRYPELTSVSAWRDGTPYPADRNTLDGKRYGGFYTQEEVRDVVAYAARRHVTVVPEIEMPGHTVAVLAAYPELGCLGLGGKYKVRCFWGVEREVFCAGNDAVYTFLQNVLSEVFELFPSEFIHIGGDECPKDRWRECDKCQKRIKEEGLANEKELQSYFIHRMQSFINTHGRTLIGWDEILEGGLAPNAAVMSWRGTDGGKAAASNGHNVVMSPTSHCYLDYYQSREKEREPPAIGGYLPLSATYEFDPAEGVPAKDHRYIMGGQGNVWTEYINSTELLEYMAYPRACAIAECLWTQSSHARRNYRDFRERLGVHFNLLDTLRVNYRKPNSSDDLADDGNNC